MKVSMEISLSDDLVEEVDKLASELRISRSQLIELAVQTYLERHETRRMMAALNEVHRDGPDEEDLAFLRGIRAYHRKLMKDEPW